MFWLESLPTHITKRTNCALICWLVVCIQIECVRLCAFQQQKHKLFKLTTNLSLVWKTFYPPGWKEIKINMPKKNSKFPGKRLRYTIPQSFTLKSTICFCNSCKHITHMCCLCVQLHLDGSRKFSDVSRPGCYSFASLSPSVHLSLSPTLPLTLIYYSVQFTFVPKQANKNHHVDIIAKFRCSREHTETIKILAKNKQSVITFVKQKVLADQMTISRQKYKKHSAYQEVAS